MSDVRKVWPKQSLEAEQVPSGKWMVPMSFCTYTDAELAASFVDAAVLTELVDAARGALALLDRTNPSEWEAEEHMALRFKIVAFDTAMRPEEGK